jgi:hypothetical protein
MPSFDAGKDKRYRHEPREHAAAHVTNIAESRVLVTSHRSTI